MKANVKSWVSMLYFYKNHKRVTIKSILKDNDWKFLLSPVSVTFNTDQGNLNPYENVHININYHTNCNKWFINVQTHPSYKFSFSHSQ